MRDRRSRLLLAEQSIPLALQIADYAYVLQTGRTAETLENDARVQRIYLGDQKSRFMSRGTHPFRAIRHWMKSSSTAMRARAY
jgi:hypothetical protein